MNRNGLLASYSEIIPACSAKFYTTIPPDYKRLSPQTFPFSSAFHILLAHRHSLSGHETWSPFCYLNHAHTAAQNELERASSASQNTVFIVLSMFSKTDNVWLTVEFEIV